VSPGAGARRRASSASTARGGSGGVATCLACLACFACLAVVGAGCGAARGPAAPPLAAAATVAVSVAAPAPAPTETPDDAFRNQPPALAAPVAASPPAVAVGTSTSGVRVMVAERHGLPLVAVSVSVSWRGSQLAPGFAHAWTNLQIGALWPSGPRLDAALGAPEEPFLVTNRRDAATVYFQKLTPQLDAGLRAVADSLTSPRIDAASTDSERDRAFSALERGWNDISIREHAAGLLLPPGHPYSLAPQGTMASVSTLSVAELARFHEENVRPDVVTVVAVGDTTLAQMVERTDRAFAGWKAAPATPASQPSSTLASDVFIVDTPIHPPRFVLAFPSPARSTRDRAALMAARAILTARLDDQVRDAVPGARAAVSGGDENSLGKHPGLFSILASAPPEVAARMIGAVLDEVSRLERGAFADHELAFARDALSRELGASLEHAFATARLISELAEYDLPTTALSTYAAALHTLTRDDVRAAARAHLGADALRIVAFGPAAPLRRALEAGTSAKITIRPAPRPHRRPRPPATLHPRRLPPAPARRPVSLLGCSDERSGRCSGVSGRKCDRR
jgi:zinc protease